MAIDRTLAGLLLLGAGGHVFGSIQGYLSQPGPLLWALSASVLLALLSALNILRTYRPGDRALAWLTVVGTGTWLCISIIFGFVIGNPVDPRVLGFAVITVSLMYFGVRDARLQRPLEPALEAAKR